MTNSRSAFDLLRRLFGHLKLVAKNYGRSFEPALDQRSAAQAIRLLDQYLSLEDPTSAWWPIAYKRYQLMEMAISSK